MQTLKDLEDYVVLFYSKEFWDQVKPTGKDQDKNPEDIIRKFFLKDLPTKTRMFREYVYTIFRSYVLPKIVKNSVSSILSLPCSNGEEAYTLAIHGLENDMYVTIVGMDINSNLIDVASEGKIYIPTFRIKQLQPWVEEGYIRHLPKYSRERNNISQANIAINQFVMDRCDFFVHDLLQRTVHDHFDAIFCLNLFVYLSDLGKETALENIVFGMNHGSLLVVDQPYWVPPPTIRNGTPRYNAKQELLYGWKVDINEFYASLHERDLGLKRISKSDSHNVYEKV